MVATSTSTVAEYLTYWLDEIIKPNRAPLTYQTYETFVRVHIMISSRRLHFGRRPGRLTFGSSASRIRHCRSVRSLRAPIDNLTNEVSG